MTERAYVETSLGGGVLHVKWTGLTKATDDVGAWYELKNTGPRYGDKTVHAYGTFGTGGKLQMQGTNELAPAGGNEFVVEDSANNDMEFTVKDAKVASQNPVRIRPAITAGDGTTDLTCEMVIRA